MQAQKLFVRPFRHSRSDAQDHDLTLEMCGACKRTLAGAFASLTGYVGETITEAVSKRL